MLSVLGATSLTVANQTTHSISLATLACVSSPTVTGGRFHVDWSTESSFSDLALLGDRARTGLSHRLCLPVEELDHYLQVMKLNSTPTVGYDRAPDRARTVPESIVFTALFSLVFTYLTK